MKKYIMAKVLIAAIFLFVLVTTSCAGRQGTGTDAAPNSGNSPKIHPMSVPQFEELCAGYSVEEALQCLKMSEVALTLNGGDFSSSGGQYMEEFYQKVKEGKPAEVLCAQYYELNPERMTAEAYEREKREYPKIFISKIVFDGSSFKLRTKEISGESSVEVREQEKERVQKEGQEQATSDEAEQEQALADDDGQETSGDSGAVTAPKSEIEEREYKYLRKYSEAIGGSDFAGRMTDIDAGGVKADINSETSDKAGSEITDSSPIDRYVLSNEKNITWGDIMRKILSSHSIDRIDCYTVFSEPAKNKIKVGEYASGEIGKDEDYSSILLEGDEFQFIVGIAISYAPGGSFEVTGDELILTGRGEDETFVLEIKSEDELKLVDFPAKYDKLLKEGETYSYMKSAKV